MTYSRQLSLFDEPSFYESADVELKSAKGGIPGSLWETYSAFANTGGGTIYLGIAETGKKIDVHGINDPSKVIDDLLSTSNNRTKVSVNLLSIINVSILTVSNNKNLVQIQVPRATRQQRPVFLNNDPLGHTYRRDHTGDYRCTEEEVRRMFADQSAEPADSRILEHFSLRDLHQVSIQQYRNRVASTNPNHPWLLEDDQQLLTKLGGWRRERGSGREGLTVAGLLMFGKEEVIRSPDALSQYHLDYRERLGDDPSQRWSDRVTIDGTWEGNLFQFYNRALPKMVTSLKMPFQLDSSLYRFDETSVGTALREALVNALIHADHGGQGGIVIDRFGDRFELSNPGTLLISHEQLLKGGVSECRNKSLQLMFQLMGAGDKAGSGIDKIRTSWDGARFLAPRLQEAQRPDRVTLILPVVSALPEASLAALREQFVHNFDSLRPEDIQILVMASEAGEVTNARLQGVLMSHRTELTRTLQHLVKNGFLKRTGFGRGARYELPLAPTIAFNETRKEGEHLRSDLSSDLSSDPSSDPSSDLSSHRTSAKPITQTTKLAADEAVETDNTAIWSELTAIAEPALTGRKGEAALKNLVLQLLERASWLTSAEVGVLLRRDGTNVRNRILRPLLRTGALRLRYTTARHPRQAYGLPHRTL